MSWRTLFLVGESHFQLETSFATSLLRQPERQLPAEKKNIGKTIIISTYMTEGKAAIGISSCNAKQIIFYIYVGVCKLLKFYISYPLVCAGCMGLVKQFEQTNSSYVRAMKNRI